MPYVEPYCSIEAPKAVEFFAQFPFIREKYWGHVLISSARLVEPKVQRMDVEFLRKSIEFRGPLGLPWGKWALDEMILLDEQGDIITEVGKAERRPETETVYGALRRIGEANIERIKHGLYIYNRRRIPLIVIYKIPREISLHDLLARYEQEGKVSAREEITAV